MNNRTGVAFSIRNKDHCKILAVRALDESSAPHDTVDEAVSQDWKVAPRLISCS